MAKFDPVYPFNHLHGKYSTGDKLSYRETFGVRHTYVLKHPYQGPFSEAQTTMRQAMGAASKYTSILFRDPAVKAEWTARCEGTNFHRPDRLCTSHYYHLFKTDPAQLQAAQAVIAADEQRKIQETVAINIAKGQAEQQLKEEQQDQSPTALLQRQVALLAAQVADLQAQLQIK